MSRNDDFETILKDIHEQIDNTVKQAAREISQELKSATQEVLRAGTEGKIYPMSNIAAQRLFDVEEFPPSDALRSAMGDWTPQVTSDVSDAQTTHSARIVADGVKHPRLVELDRSLGNVTSNPTTNATDKNDPGEYPFVDEVMKRMQPRIDAIMGNIDAH